MTVELFQADPDLGDLFVVNGIDPVLFWDGFNDNFIPAGMIAPTAAVHMSGSGVGSIVGTYYAYERFVDVQGNVSNLSPISAEFTAEGTTGNVSSCTSNTPIVVTSASHGLVTGAWVKLSGVGGIDTANNTWQVTVVDANTFSLDNSSGDGISIYNGGGTWISGVSTVNYSSVQVPTDARVTHRQILRNTDGQAKTFYVDVDSTDLLATTFSSSQNDTDLQTGEAVPLLDSNGDVFANANEVPPSIFKCIAQQLDRMFLAGLLEYTVGACSVTFGSPTVTGAGTAWKSTMAGRFLYVDGASQTYEISSVNETTQTITLTGNFADATDLFAFYSIKPPPAYRRIVQFSRSGAPQSWLSTNALSIQETGDEITGLFSMGAYLYITERSHLHKLTFAQSPNIDGAAFMTANRGAVNQRCIIVVDSSAYMLDELGVHKFSGNSQVDNLSDGIGAIFRKDKDDVDIKINWRWKEYFHASLDRQRETIRWFVCLDGNRYPRHALTLQYRVNRWWIEEFPMCVGGACVGYLGGFTGTPQVYYGAEFGKVMAAWADTTDIVDSRETVRSVATAADSFTLTDGLETFPVGMLNAPIGIVSGTGKGQDRRIVAVSGSTVTIDRPWEVLPDTTSVYQIGGIHWWFRSSWIRLAPTETMSDRRFEMLFEPMPNPASALLRFFSDYSGNADKQASTMASSDGGGIAAVAGDPDLVVDLTRQTGLVDRRLPGGKEYFIKGKRYVQYELEGFSNEDQIRLYQFLYQGAQNVDSGQ
jgi:hypothetical protein